MKIERLIVYQIMLRNIRQDSEDFKKKIQQEIENLHSLLFTQINL